MTRVDIERSSPMFNNSPLESLAAFALAFLAGALMVLGLDRYVPPSRRRPCRSPQPNPTETDHPNA